MILRKTRFIWIKQTIGANIVEMRKYPNYPLKNDQTISEASTKGHQTILST